MKRIFFPTILSLVFLFFVPGIRLVGASAENCVEIPLKEFILENRKNLKIIGGTFKNCSNDKCPSKSQIISIMGNKCARAGDVVLKNPSREEDVVCPCCWGKEECEEIKGTTAIYYYDDIVVKDGKIEYSSDLPIVFKNDILLGVGYVALPTTRGASFEPYQYKMQEEEGIADKN